MIKIENTEVYGFEAAIRGMRSPMNSWGKSDSTYCKGRSAVCDTCPIEPDDDYAPCYFASSGESALNADADLWCEVKNEHLITF